MRHQSMERRHNKIVDTKDQCARAAGRTNTAEPGGEISKRPEKPQALLAEKRHLNVAGSGWRKHFGTSAVLRAYGLTSLEEAYFARKIWYFFLQASCVE
jgi:hypothetical protein